jgi:hypothetical protein
MPMRTDGAESLGLPMIGQAALDGDGALDGPIRIIERQEEAVPGALDLLPAVLGHQGAKGLVVPADHLAPRLIAHELGQLRRIHDVGEG